MDGSEPYGVVWALKLCHELTNADALTDWAMTSLQAMSQFVQNFQIIALYKERRIESSLCQNAFRILVKKPGKSYLEWEGWWITEQCADSINLSLVLVPFPGGCIVHSQPHSLVYRHCSTAVVRLLSICWTHLLLLSRNQGSTCSHHGLIGKSLETFESGLRKKSWGGGGDMNVLLCLQRYEQVVFLLLVWNFCTWWYILKYNRVFSKSFHNCGWRNHQTCIVKPSKSEYFLNKSWFDDSGTTTIVYSFK